MKNYFFFFFAAIVLSFGNAFAETNAWETYCKSPEDAFITGIASSGDADLVVITYSKLFTKKVQDPSWSFITNVMPDDSKSRWFVGSGIVIVRDGNELVRYSFLTKETTRFALPAAAGDINIKFIAADDKRCAIWGYFGIQMMHYVYDFTTSQWNAGESTDYAISDMVTDANGNIWRTLSGELGYEHYKSTDLGDNWSLMFTNTASKMFIDKSGALFCCQNGEITSVSEQGKVITTFKGIGTSLPKNISIYGQKLIVQYNSNLLFADIATQKNIDTISCNTNEEGYFSGIACMGSYLYAPTYLNLYKYNSLDEPPVIEKSGITSAMGMFLTPYKDHLLMRSAFGIYGIDQHGATKLSGAFSQMDNTNGKDMFVTPDNTIYVYDSRLRKLQFSANDGQSWSNVVIPSGEIPQYVTYLPMIGVVIATNNSNRVYAAQVGSTEATLIATFNAPNKQEFHCIKMFGTKIFAITNEYICKSIDGGANWSMLPCTDFYSVSDLFDMGNNTMWIAAGKSILETTNDGETWTPVVDNLNFLFPMQFADKSLILSNAFTKDIYVIKPDQSFKIMPTPAPDPYITSFCVDANYIYASSLGGEVYRSHLAVLPAEDEVRAVATSAYPNPASSHVTIELGEQANDVTVEVFNAIGELQNVATSHNDKVVLLNTQSLPAGVYAARLFANGKTQTVRFVVSK